MEDLHATDSLRQGSRLTQRIEFVMPCGELEEQVQARYESLRITAGEIGDSIPNVHLELFKTIHGRGASGEAIGLIVGLLGAPGGLYATVQVVKRVFQKLRKRGENPCLSLGAATHLCIADFLAKNRSLRTRDIYVLLATEAASGEYTRGVDNLDRHIHAGDELFLVLLACRRNVRSWLYLVDSHGGIIHYSVGRPVPPGVLFYRGRPWDFDSSSLDDITYLGDDEV